MPLGRPEACPEELDDPSLVLGRCGERGLEVERPGDEPGLEAGDERRVCGGEILRVMLVKVVIGEPVDDG